MQVSYIGVCFLLHAVECIFVYCSGMYDSVYIAVECIKVYCSGMYHSVNIAAECIIVYCSGMYNTICETNPRCLVALLRHLLYSRSRTMTVMVMITILMVNERFKSKEKAL